jgi:hypothetical protein
LKHAETGYNIARYSPLVAAFPTILKGTIHRLRHQRSQFGRKIVIQWDW